MMRLESTSTSPSTSSTGTSGCPLTSTACDRSSGSSITTSAASRLWPSASATRSTLVENGIAYSVMPISALEDLQEPLLVVERTDQAEVEAVVHDQLPRDALDVVGSDRLDALKHLVDLGHPVLQHLPPQAEHQQ